MEDEQVFSIVGSMLLPSRSEGYLKTNGQMSYSKLVWKIHQEVSTTYCLRRKQLRKSDSWCSAFITVRDGPARASHRHIYSLWWEEMGKALHPPELRWAELTERSTFEFCSDGGEHSTLSSLNSNHSPFQASWSRSTEKSGYELCLVASPFLCHPLLKDPGCTIVWSPHGPPSQDKEISRDHKKL